MKPSEMPSGWKYGYTFESYTLNPVSYLSYLSRNLKSQNVPIIRKRVSSIDEAFTVFNGISLVINATGLGSRSLLGVCDPLVHPARGQTVLVKAPNVTTCYSMKDPIRQQSSGIQTYIIPRPGSDGHVILGGTYIEDDYSTLPDPKVAEMICSEAYRLCPALGNGKGVEGFKIVSHNVGLRPVRTGGMRLELEKRRLGKGVIHELLPHEGKTMERDVAVVHAYGIGPAG